MRETPITFSNVSVDDSTSLSLRCTLQGKLVQVARLQMLPGSTISEAGDVGTLVLPRWAVQDLGLTEPRSA